MTWDCVGGVETSATDESSNTSSTSYTNAYFWRPDGAVDQSSNTTSISYGTTPTTVEASLVAEERSKGLSAVQIAKELVNITNRLEIVK